MTPETPPEQGVSLVIKITSYEEHSMQETRQQPALFRVVQNLSPGPQPGPYTKKNLLNLKGSEENCQVHKWIVVRNRIS